MKLAALCCTYHRPHLLGNWSNRFDGRITRSSFVS